MRPVPNPPYGSTRTPSTSTANPSTINVAKNERTNRRSSRVATTSICRISAGPPAVRCGSVRKFAVGGPCRVVKLNAIQIPNPAYVSPGFVHRIDDRPQSVGLCTPEKLGHVASLASANAADGVGTDDVDARVDVTPSHG